jgi:hypothetical protein
VSGTEATLDLVRDRATDLGMRTMFLRPSSSALEIATGTSLALP